MAKIYPNKLKKNDTFIFQGKQYVVSSISYDSNDRTRVHTKSDGSFSIPNEKQVDKV